VRLSDLPDEYPVACDTETSGNQTDSRSRIAVVSFAFRMPDPDGYANPENPMVARAIPFDQGVNHLILGHKYLDERTAKRVAKWPEWARNEDAGNRHPDEYRYLVEQLSRLNLIGHGFKFDMNHFAVGLRGRPDLAIDLESALLWDTMVGQRIIEPTLDADLKGVSVRKSLGRELGVKEGMEDEEAQALKPWLGPRTGKNADARFDLVPWSVMEHYAGMDAKLGLLLFEHQWAEWFEEPYAFQLPHMRREMELLKVLYRMERRGMPFDVRTAREMEKLIEAERARVAATLPFEPTPNKARDYFFGEPPAGLGHPIFSDKVTEKRRDPQVDDEVIARLVSEDWKGQNVARVYQTHEELKSANSKWYVAWPARAGSDGRLRTNFKQTDVISGRLAVGHIQLQAIPHVYQLPKLDGLVGVRDLFHETDQCWICRNEPMVLGEFDISQAEIRIATAVARCRPMLEGFYRGDDSHSIAARLMFSDLFAADGFAGNEEQHPNWTELRGVAAKRSNLGILYGAGSRTIQDTIRKFTGRTYPLWQIKEWIERWHAAFPQFSETLYKYERIAVNVGWVKLVNGRQRAFRPYEPLHKAFNQMIQGSLAETMKDVMILVENAMPDRMLLQIHDSLVLRLSPCQLEQQKQVVQDILISTYEQAYTFKWGDVGERVVVPFVSDYKQFGKVTA
jgi:DNA polymerase I-like protein with 3'-5' exonuclease and polymerase domains